METLDVCVQLFRENKDPSIAIGMKKYMRDQFPFLGIKSPLRSMTIKELWRDYPLRNRSELLDFVEGCWTLPEREFQYAAMEALWKYRKLLLEKDLALLTRLITNKSWWDSVDFLAGKMGSYFFLRFPECLVNGPDQWVVSNHMWLNRSAILFQLNHKEKTDEKRLFSFIDQHRHSDEFFIQKAIGWALRQYGKTAPEKVRSFVAKANLKPLSRREALKHIG